LATHDTFPQKRILFHSYPRVIHRNGCELPVKVYGMPLDKPTARLIEAIKKGHFGRSDL
jgi:hypothetical protein